jgi:hypothetical protein
MSSRYVVMFGPVDTSPPVAFVPWIVRVVEGRIVVARIPDGVWSDPLFQRFNVQTQLPDLHLDSSE